MNFEQWWHEHGSGWRIADGDDCEDHSRKVAALAWDEARAAQPAEQQPAPDVSGLVEALERIAAWPDGGNQCGQTNIKIFAAEVLATYRKQGSGS